MQLINYGMIYHSSDDCGNSLAWGCSGTPLNFLLFPAKIIIHFYLILISQDHIERAILSSRHDDCFDSVQKFGI
jgi:hypothetical protein